MKEMRRFSREVSIGGRDWLNNIGLKNDDFLQSYADITDLKKQQSDQIGSKSCRYFRLSYDTLE